MHNRKEGALVLLAANGATLAIAGAQWIELANAQNIEAASLMGRFSLFPAIGALAAYIALRNSGSEGDGLCYRISELFGLLAVCATVIALFVNGLLGTVPFDSRTPDAREAEASTPQPPPPLDLLEPKPH
jgi:hypothetical protein